MFNFLKVIGFLLASVSVFADVPFVTGQTITAVKLNNQTRDIGFRFKNDSGTTVTVTQLGRWVITGNNQTHTLRIYSDTGTSLASVVVDCNGATAGQFLYGTLAVPYDLQPNTYYYITSSEVSGGDQWYSNGGTNLTWTAVGSNLTSGYVEGGVVHNNSDNSRSLGPVSFQYSAPLDNWTKSGTTYTTDGSQYSVKSALVHSSTGDTVNVPAGTFTWGTGASYILVSKAVTLAGAGPLSTIINISPTGRTYASGTVAVTAAATVKDMAFVQSGAATTTAVTVGGTNGWRVTNCKYTSASTVGYFIYFSTYGLIDNCTVTGGGGNDEWIFGRGPADSWQTPDSMGTVNATYIEDCTFLECGYTDFNANSRGVVRYCTLTPGTGKYIKLDSHGKVTNSPSRSVRHTELYGNTWTAGSTPAIELRGGTGIVFNNTDLGAVTKGIMLGDYYVTYGTYDASDYPIDDQIGVGMDPKVAGSEPFYLFGNRVGVSNWAASNILWGRNMAGVIDPNRDYFDYAPAFNGTGGVGIGTAAQMNAITPTLTKVGFWVTDEGEWNSTNGAIPDGRLYVWNGSAWVLKYTPYTYPHPLRGVLPYDSTYRPKTRAARMRIIK